MANDISFVGRLTIANSGTDSNVLANNTLATCERLIIRCPATLTGTCTLQSSPSEKAAFSDTLPVRIYPATTDVALVAGKELHIPHWSGKALAIKSSMAEGGARVFDVFSVADI